MRYLTILVLCTLLLAGCQSGPGADCDECSLNEVQAVAAPGGNAAAAGAVAGQRASNAPFVEDKVSPRTKVTVGRGGGDTYSGSADMEHRAVSSGGAQNLALMNPATASADASGGVSLSVQEAAKSVASARRVYEVAAMNPATSDGRLEFLADQIIAAQEKLNAATASSRSNVTNNYHMGGDNTIVGYSRAGNGEGPDTPEALEAMKAAAERVLPGKPPVKTAPETPDVPPAGPAGDPNGGG